MAAYGQKGTFAEVTAERISPDTLAQVLLPFLTQRVSFLPASLGELLLYQGAPSRQQCRQFSDLHDSSFYEVFSTHNAIDGDWLTGLFLVPDICTLSNSMSPLTDFRTT